MRAVAKPIITSTPPITSTNFTAEIISESSARERGICTTGMSFSQVGRVYKHSTPTRRKSPALLQARNLSSDGAFIPIPSSCVRRWHDYFLLETERGLFFSVMGTSSAIRYSRLQCSQTARAMMTTLLMSPLRSQWRFVDGVDG